MFTKTLISKITFPPVPKTLGPGRGTPGRRALPTGLEMQEEGEGGKRRQVMGWTSGCALPPTCHSGREQLVGRAHQAVSML